MPGARVAMEGQRQVGVLGQRLPRVVLEARKGPNGAEVPGAVWIEVVDQGPGFDPDMVPDPTCDENLEKPCGRGILLMRSYMSQVEFNSQGNCVTMEKLRSDPTDEG